MTGVREERETERQDSGLVGSRPCSVAASRDEDDGMNVGQWGWQSSDGHCSQPIRSGEVTDVL